jgi:hypothetical protein
MRKKVARGDEIAAVRLQVAPRLRAEVRESRAHLLDEFVVGEDCEVNALELEVGSDDSRALVVEPVVDVLAPALLLPRASSRAVATPQFGVHARHHLHHPCRRHLRRFVAFTNPNHADIEAAVDERRSHLGQREAVALGDVRKAVRGLAYQRVPQEG